MPVRTLNYTERKRIGREHARIELRTTGQGTDFDASLNLDDAKLPPDGRVFVEAYRRASYMRFDFGTIAAPRKPVDCTLRAFDKPDGVLFRVKVVSARPRGRLLAQADRIRPRAEGDPDGATVPLLPVMSDDLGDQIWRLEFDGQQVLLAINTALGDKDAVVRHPAFSSLVYPAIVREVLTRVLFIEKERDTEDPDYWCSQWLAFAAGLPGMTAPPEGDDQEELLAWVNDAVAAFCGLQNTRGAFETFWTGENRT